MILGSLEFECAIIFIFCVADMILGTINHIFFQHNNASTQAENSIGKKLVIMVTLTVILIIVHLNDAKIFDGSVQAVIDMADKTASAVVILFLYYELTSILKHISQMTGIDLSKIPGVKSEINSEVDKYDKK